MKNLQIALPLWVRAILLAGVVCILAGAGLISYRFYAQPRTLTIAVGSLDGEAKQLLRLTGGRLFHQDMDAGRDGRPQDRCMNVLWRAD